jgi:Putative phage tail protein
MDSFVDVRTDVAGFARDVAEMRSVLEAGLGTGADRAGRLIETGLAATGDSVRGVAETLAQAMPFSCVVESAGLKARFGSGPLRAVAANDRGASAGKKAVALSTERVAAAAIPDLVTLAYNDVARDYLVGAQRAKRDSTSRREARVELPAALEAGAAKAIAEARLGRFWAERSRASVTLPWRALDVVPGDRVSVPGLSGLWRVARVTFEAMVVRLDLVLLAPASVVSVAADPGRNRPQVDLPHGPTTLAVLDLPQLGDVPEAAPFVAVAANGVSGGWRRAALMTSIDGGATWVDAGGAAFPAVMGQTVTALGAGDVDLIDRVNSVEVQLVHPGLTLVDANDDALLAGGNLAMIGEELLQFGRAEPLGAGRWRLSELWRGRRGTEWAVGTQTIGARFVLIESLALARLPAASAVDSVQVMAVGVGDSAGVVALGPSLVGVAVRPLVPIGLRWDRSGGDVVVRWTRRSRDGWRWRDSVEVPLGEEVERYRVTKVAAGRPDLVVETSTPEWIYPSAERAADFAAGATNVTVSIAQIGSLGVSRSTVITLPTN